MTGGHSLITTFNRYDRVRLNENFPNPELRGVTGQITTLPSTVLGYYSVVFDEPRGAYTKTIVKANEITLVPPPPKPKPTPKYSEGDVVRITTSEDVHEDVRGQIVTITKVQSGSPLCDVLYTVEGAKNEPHIRTLSEEYVVRKASLPDYKIGDVVYVSTDACQESISGKTLKITAIDDNGDIPHEDRTDYLYTFENGRQCSGYLVLFTVKFRIGDVVKIDDTSIQQKVAGKVLMISDVHAMSRTNGGKFPRYIFKDEDGNVIGKLAHWRMKLIAPAGTPEPKYQKGDKVRIAPTTAWAQLRGMVLEVQSVHYNPLGMRYAYDVKAPKELVGQNGIAAINECNILGKATKFKIGDKVKCQPPTAMSRDSVGEIVAVDTTLHDTDPKTHDVVYTVRWDRRPQDTLTYPEGMLIAAPPEEWVLNVSIDFSEAERRCAEFNEMYSKFVNPCKEMVLCGTRTGRISFSEPPLQTLKKFPTPKHEIGTLVKIKSAYAQNGRTEHGEIVDVKLTADNVVYCVAFGNPRHPERRETRSYFENQFEVVKYQKGDQVLVAQHDVIKNGLAGKVAEIEGVMHNCGEYTVYYFVGGYNLGEAHIEKKLSKLQAAKRKQHGDRFTDEEFDWIEKYGNVFTGAFETEVKPKLETVFGPGFMRGLSPRTEKIVRYSAMMAFSSAGRRHPDRRKYATKEA